MHTLSYSISTNGNRRALILAEGTFLLELPTTKGQQTFPVIDNTMRGGFIALVNRSGDDARFFDANGKAMTPKAVRQACE